MVSKTAAEGLGHQQLSNLMAQLDVVGHWAKVTSSTCSSAPQPETNACNSLCNRLSMLGFIKLVKCGINYYL